MIKKEETSCNNCGRTIGRYDSVSFLPPSGFALCVVCDNQYIEHKKPMLKLENIEA